MFKFTNMVFVAFSIGWTIGSALLAYGSWRRLKTRRKVALMVVWSCLYFVGIFSGYSYFQ